jgi:hypothetical protein
MAASPSPLDNRLLAALADDDSNRWLDGLAYQELPLGKVLYESGDAQTQVYFRRQRSSLCCTSWPMAPRPKSP